MSKLGWKLRRLRAMSAGEVAHRVHHAVRDRWFAPAWTRLSPAGAYPVFFPKHRALFGGAGVTAPHARHAKDLARAAAWLPGAIHADDPEAGPLRAHAAALARGEWSLFGHPAKLADPVRWNANPLTGAEWPDAPARKLDYRDPDIAGGVKFTWELGRLTLLPDLALAARLGETDARTRVLALLAQWNARNPLGHGIHYTSGIELAVRVATVSATLALLGREDDAAFDDVLEPSLGLVAQQACWCRDHLSLGSSANNHLLAELMAMAVLGGAWPSAHGASGLLRAGRRGLERETLLQLLADGASAEQSFGYLPFVWELILLGLRAADAAGHEPHRAVRERLAASLDFARAVRGPDGRMPQVGDEDDGRVLLATLEVPRLDLVGNALAAFVGADALSNEPLANAYVRLLGLSARPAREATDGRHEFPEGGYSVWRERGLRVVFDHGPLGFGALAAHGHADALSLTIARGADDLVVDPGTFAYQEDPVARARCRSTAVHATVCFGAGNQSEMLGPFLWGRRATIETHGEGWRCRWYTGETHARRVHVEAGVVTIHDEVTGRDPQLVFPLAPGAEATIDGASVIVKCGSSRATFSAEGIGAWQLEAAMHAPRYTHLTSAQRLVAPITGAQATTTITVGEAT